MGHRNNSVPTTNFAGGIEFFSNPAQNQTKPQPSRSSNKAGRVEISNGILKTAIERLKWEFKNSTRKVVARASLISNLIKGSNSRNSF